MTDNLSPGRTPIGPTIVVFLINVHVSRKKVYSIISHRPKILYLHIELFGNKFGNMVGNLYPTRILLEASHLKPSYSYPNAT